MSILFIVDLFLLRFDADCVIKKTCCNLFISNQCLFLSVCTVTIDYTSILYRYYFLNLGSSSNKVWSFLYKNQHMILLWSWVANCCDLHWTELTVLLLVVACVPSLVVLLWIWLSCESSTDVPSYLATNVKWVVSQVLMLSELCNNLCCHYVKSFSHFNGIKKLLFAFLWWTVTIPFYVLWRSSNMICDENENKSQQDTWTNLSMPRGPIKNNTWQPK